MSEATKTVGMLVLIRVLLRSLLLQASWSFERMQSLGFGYALIPALRKLSRNDEEYGERVKFHAEYFNTQPYLAAFILGAVVRKEERRVAGTDSDESITALKETLAGPLGALGDSFYWGSLKPLAATIAAAMIIAGWWWGPLLYLILYNSWHLGIRTSLLFWGYSSAGDAVALVGRFNFTKWARLFKGVSLSVAGAIVGMLPLWREELRLPGAVPVPYLAAGGATVALLFLMLMRRGGSPIHMMLGLAALCLLLAYLGAA